MKCILSRILQSSGMKLFTASMLWVIMCINVYAQSSVTGKVTDEHGQPIFAASVMVVGSQTIVATDLDGRFTISAPSKSVLEIMYLGKKTVQYALADHKGGAISIVLEDDTTVLDDVVVVGYGSAKKSSITSAVSAMKGEDLLAAPSTNVSQLLAGKLSGLSSVQESGEPGSDGASLRIRGSRYGAAYIVDGFPVSDINDIDPNDIESISVLKDAASAAVYGLQGAGGVIIVTTKSGDLGKTKITYNASFGASMNANFPKFMNGPQFAHYYNMAQMMDQLASGAIASKEEYQPYFTGEQVDLMLNGDPTDGWDNVDYFEKVFGTGFTQKHSVTVQGGNSKTRYFTSFGYMGQDGNIDNFHYNRYNLRSNIESDFAKNFHFKLGVSGYVADRQTPGYVSGGTDSNSYLGELGFLSVGRQTIQMHPYLPEKYNGKYTGAIQKNISQPCSPLAAIYESGYKKTKSVSLSTNFSLSYDVPWVKGLSLKVAGSFDYGTSWNKNLDTPYSVMVNTRDVSGTWTWAEKEDPRGNKSTGISLGEGQSQYFQLVGQASINYANSFGKNNVELMALLEARDNKSNSLSAYAQNLPFAELPELNLGTPHKKSPIGGYSGASRSAGYVFRAKYDYDERYLAEFTGRLDGSYKFFGMANQRWGFFPSGSIGWRLSKESFMSDVDIIDDLKIRASAGLLGNDAVSAYMFLSTLYNDKSWPGVMYDGVFAPSYQPSGVPNTQLTWEKTLSYNVGFDLTMWDGLLGMEVDGFYNYNYDILGAQYSGFPSSMGGYYPTWVNYNAVDSKGIDILITHRNSVMAGGHPLYYGLSFNLTYSKSRWIKYKDDPNIAEWRKVVGTTVGAIDGWLADGLFRSEEEIDNSAWYGTRPCVGDIKYVDLNGDGKIDYNDRGKFGRSNRPELTYGLNFNLEWNGIDFNAQFTGGALFDVSLTGTYYNYYDDNTIWTQTFKESANSPLFLVQNAYSVENPNGTFPRLTLGAPGHGGDNGLSSSFWWRDGKYVRLKSAQLGYTFPKKWTGKIGISALRIFVEGQNLFTIDGLPEGIDPESPGVNNGYYPQQRYVMGGLTLTF